MKVIICFRVTPQLCLLLRPHRHPWNKEWEVSSCQTLPVNMLSVCLMIRLLLKLSHCAEGSQSQLQSKELISIPVSYLKCRNSATCLSVRRASFIIPYCLTDCSFSCVQKSGLRCVSQLSRLCVMSVLALHPRQDSDKMKEMTNVIWGDLVYSYFLFLCSFLPGVREELGWKNLCVWKHFCVTHFEWS